MRATTGVLKMGDVAIGEIGPELIGAAQATALECYIKWRAFCDRPLVRRP